jgi:hypothetical protein
MPWEWQKRETPLLAQEFTPAGRSSPRGKIVIESSPATEPTMLFRQAVLVAVDFPNLLDGTAGELVLLGNIKPVGGALYPIYLVSRRLK